MIEIHRRFDRFAASSVRCLSEASSQRELADKRPVKMPSMDFVFQTPVIYFWFYLYVNTLEPNHPQIKIQIVNKNPDTAALPKAAQTNITISVMRSLRQILLSKE